MECRGPVISFARFLGFLVLITNPDFPSTPALVSVLLTQHIRKGHHVPESRFWGQTVAPVDGICV